MFVSKIIYLSFIVIKHIRKTPRRVKYDTRLLVIYNTNIVARPR